MSLYAKFKNSLRLVAVLLIAKSAVADGRIKIGAPLALTGEASAYGIDMKNALLFANKRFFQDRYQIILEDDRCNPKDAVSVTQKLANVDNVSYLLGYSCSGPLLAAAPLIERSKLLTITPSASSPAVTFAGDYIFRTWPSDALSSKVLYDYISKHHKSLGILSEESQYAQDLRRTLESLNSSKSLAISNESFLPGSSDLRTQLLKLRNRGVEALLLNPQAEPGLILSVRQIIELKWPVQIYGNFFPGSAAFLSVLGKDADGIIFSDTPTLDQVVNPHGMEIYNEFVAEYGKPQSTDVIIVACWMAFEAIDEAIRSGIEPKTFLYKSRIPSHVSPEFSFDSNGDIVGVSQVLKTISNGKVKADISK